MQSATFAAIACRRDAGLQAACVSAHAVVPSSRISSAIKCRRGEAMGGTALPPEGSSCPLAMCLGSIRMRSDRRGIDRPVGSSGVGVS